jgi:hypothetical protein
MLNNYCGNVLLSMPFCFVKSDWMAAGLLLLLTAFGAFTGSLIILSYRVIQAEGMNVPSYAQIGERCMGRFGKYLVLTSSIIETFVGVLCMGTIVWTNAALLLPNVAWHWVVSGCILLSFPTNFLRDFSRMAFLSNFGVSMICLIIVVVLYSVLVAAPPDSAATPATPTALARLDGLPMSASIMLAGLTGHVGLPPQYAGMKTQRDFTAVLYTSFGILFCIYCVVGVCGYHLYGDDASVLLTQDMAARQQDDFGAAMSDLIVVGITFKLFCSVPMCVAVMVDIAQNLYRERTGHAISRTATDGVRIGIWTLATICTLFVSPWLQFITALIGVNSMLISVLLPLSFYLILHGERMDACTRLAWAVLVLLSVAFTAVIGYIDFLDFMQSSLGKT